MINYYIASDYQKIVRDIIFYMYLISVHIETCGLAGLNVELFMGGISITYSLSNWQWGLCVEEVIRAFSIGLKRCSGFIDEKESQSNNPVRAPWLHSSKIRAIF